VSTNSDTSITCDLASTPVSGSWLPEVRDANGLIPVDGGVSPQVIGITASSVSPNSGLNPAGNQTLTISGSDFPASLATDDSITITFDDGSKCTIISSSSTSIQCKTATFSAVNQAYTLTIDINGQTSNSLNINVGEAPTSITAISPSSVSPVLKTQIIFTVDSSNTGTLS
jgi:hypothetical protein